LEPRELIVGQRHRDRTGLAGDTADQTASIEFDDHLVDAGGVTWKNRWKSASAGGRRFSRVYEAMNVRYCPAFQ
jgi:hypothetical protein